MTTKKTDNTQYKRFVETAHALGCDESEEAFCQKAEGHCQRKAQACQEGEEEMKRLILIIPLLILTGCPLEDSEKDKTIEELKTRIATLEAQKVPYQRYQIIMSPQVARNTFLLDTQKGKVWTRTTLTDVQDNPTVWMEDDVIDASGEIGVSIFDYMKYHKTIPNK